MKQQKFFFPALFLAAVLILPGPAGAETLKDAMAKAYTTNPGLQAALAELRESHENIALVNAGWRPRISAEAQAGKIKEESEGDFFDRDETRSPAQIALTAQQPLYRGGQLRAAIRQAELRARAQYALFRQAEQDLLLSAATAYLDLIAANAVLDLARNSERVLQEHLAAVQDRFEVGDVTVTDVSQAKSRLAGAVARRREAEGGVRTAAATYRRIIGDNPGNLENPAPPANMPEDIDHAVIQADSDNPMVAAARLLEEAADAGIDIAFADLLPSLNLNGAVIRGEDQSIRGSESKTARLTLDLTVPLYEGGASYARVRAAKENRYRSRMEAADTEREVRAEAVRAWENWQTALATLEAFEEQIEAAEAAVRTVRDEEQAGNRTVLDVLDAEQELLDAQVSLVESRRNAHLAALAVRAAIGSLMAAALDLPVETFAIEEHYRLTRGRWIGTNPATPHPVSAEE